MPDAVVDIWRCDASGVYSGVDESLVLRLSDEAGGILGIISFDVRTR